MAWEKVVDIVGPPGTFDQITVESIAPDATPSATVGGTPANRTAHFRLNRGLPGTNAVANDNAFATYLLALGSLTRNATNTAFLQDLGNPDSIVRGGLDARYWPTSNTRPIGKGELTLNVQDFGALPNGTNVSYEFQAALNSAEAQGARVMVPPGQYVVNNLIVGNGVRVYGGAGFSSRFGLSIGTPTRKSAVDLAHAPGSTDPIMTVAGAGSGVENIAFSGNGAPGPGLVMQGFESVLRHIRIINVPNIALDVQKSNNPRWEHIYIDDCGTATLEGMRVWSKEGAGHAAETNTLDINGLTIERCANTALTLGYKDGDLTNREYYAEFVKIHNLHIESHNLNTGAGLGKGNLSPLIWIGDVRQVTLSSAFIYGGPGPLIAHNQNPNRQTWGNGGIKLIGGTLMGSNTYNLPATPHLIHLVKGDDFTLQQMGMFRASQQLVKVDAGYGDRYLVDPTCYPNITALDARPRQSDYNFRGNVVVHGHIKTTGTAPTAVTGGVGANNLTFLPGATDAAGAVTFGTGGSVATGTVLAVQFNKAYPSPPVVVISPRSDRTALMNLSVDATSTQFSVRNVNTPAANQAAGSFGFNYVVIGS